MLKKQNRLAKAKEIKAVFAQGRGFFNPYFTIKFAPNRLKQSRFTVVVSTKVFKKATKRNRLKRVLREFIRLHLNKFKIGDYVIILRPKVAQIQERFLFQSFYQLILESRLFQT